MIKSESMGRVCLGYKMWCVYSCLLLNMSVRCDCVPVFKCCVCGPSVSVCVHVDWIVDLELPKGSV